MFERILVTGTKSGLGAALLDRFGTAALTREDDPADLKDDNIYDAIIHCAFDHAIFDNNSKIRSNLALFDAVRIIPCKRFVYISSIDVYPTPAGRRQEDMPITATRDDNAYRATTIACEARLLADCGQFLILRPTALLGAKARPNSLMRMRSDPSCKLTLAPESAFNYVLHRQISDFIFSALRNDVTGIFNIASADNISLGEVAQLVNARPEYGKFRYEVGNIDNRKAQSVLTEFARSSRSVIEEFMKTFE